MNDATANSFPIPQGELERLQEQVDNLRQEVKSLAQASQQQAALQERLDLLGVEVDQIQTEMNRPRRWYSDASVMIALLALLFSLGTTLFAYYQNSQQQVGAYKTELRDIITRISAIPRDYTVYTQTYTDPTTLSLLNGYLQAENAMLAKRAMEISSRIPEEITSSEYLLIGQSLFNSNVTEETLQVYDKAIQRATNSSDLVAALKAKANLQILLGEVDAGRNTYQRALQVFERLPVSNEFYRNSTHALTHMNWAASEYIIGECENVRLHLAEAQKFVDLLRPENSAEFFRQQLEAYQASAQSCK